MGALGTVGVPFAAVTVLRVSFFWGGGRVTRVKFLIESLLAFTVAVIN